MAIYHKTFGKINWILKVFKKEENQKKHKIDTVMQIYPARFDKIKIVKYHKLSVEYLYHGKTPFYVDNCSITRIIKWINEFYPDINTNYYIKVKKFIPLSSGFGGESTDAAYVLRYILKKNRIKDLSEQELLDIAQNVGSDIPFFYKKVFIAHVNEYGNRVVRLKYSIPFNPDVISFSCESRTKEIYEMLDEDKSYKSQIPDVKALYDEIKHGNIKKNTVYNDLQKYVFIKHPQIKKRFEEYERNEKAINFVNGAGSTLVTVKG